MSGTLEVRHLTKRFNGLPAVNDVSFTIAPGEILGYIGPNGAGKSTTVKIIIGLLAPSEGRLLWNGRSVLDDMPAFQSRVGYVPEEPNVYPFLSGWEYLLLAGRLRGIAQPALKAKIGAFLRLFSLWDDRDAPLSSYSKGMRQKILLASALMHNPDLLVLDEPLTGLDAGSMIALRALLERLAAQGKTILYSSHVLAVMEQICSRVLILRKGCVAACDTIGHLRETMSESSLEGVFARFTGEGGNRRLTDGLIEAMQS